MLNDESVYWHAGFIAGRAARFSDAATVHAQHDFYRRMRDAESAPDRKLAEVAYKRGYAEAHRS